MIVRSATRLTPQVKASTPAVTAKVCPYCISNVPLQATRCPNCTSQLDPAPALQTTGGSNLR